MQLLTLSDADFEAKFERLVRDRRESDAGVSRDVSDILNEVRERGDGALVEYTMRFDEHRLGTEDGWSISAAECEQAYHDLDDDLRDALETAARRIRAYHERQLPQDSDYTDEIGMRLGSRWLPVDAAGLYVPGGRAAYPSSAADECHSRQGRRCRAAGGRHPTPGGTANPLVLAAAHVAGVDEIWRVGGAQAVAALAYGTERIAPVDVITGPGNAWVAEAKRQLFGMVGIDMVAGPSEILVIADGGNDAEIIAADLLSQAEHDPTSQSILITDDPALAARVQDAIELQLLQLPTGKTARQSWDDNGLIVIIDNLADAVPLADRLAAEHVELAVADPEPLFARLRHAGSVFLGRHTPEAVGDYIAGPNHVLPTGRRARFASGLSVLDFMKRTSFIGATPAALQAIGPAAVRLAEAEGLPAHALSISKRLS